MHLGNLTQVCNRLTSLEVISTKRDVLPSSLQIAPFSLGVVIFAFFAMYLVLVWAHQVNHILRQYQFEKGEPSIPSALITCLSATVKANTDLYDMGER